MEKKEIKKGIEQSLKQTSDTPQAPVGPMPEPQIKDYQPTFKLTDKFINEITAVLGEYPYAQTHQLFKTIEGRENRTFTIPELNGLIQAITQFPYKSVKPIMTVIEKAETQAEYWTPVN